jgi:hypothetical protein
VSAFADFTRRFGPIRPLETANARWRACRVPSRDYPNSAPMFAGQFWTSGYFLPGEDPAAADLPWDTIAQDAAASRALAERLADVMLHTDTDSPYVPCFFRLPDAPDFGAALKVAIGWQVEAEFEQSQFWGDIQVRTLAPGSDAFFWDPLDDDIVAEYYNPAALAALREVTATMRATLAALRHLTFPEAYVTYPDFWLGRTPRGSWLGLWALRVDT